MGAPTYELLADLDGDGIPETDTLGDQRVAEPVGGSRGLDGARIISPPSAGKFTAVLDNRGDDYGPSSGLQKGRAIAFRETGGYDGTPRALWAGILERPERTRSRIDAVAAVSAFGMLSRIAGKKAATALLEACRTDEALDALLTAIGWPENSPNYASTNPRLATNATSWSAAGGATNTGRVAKPGQFGAYSYQVDANGSGHGVTFDNGALPAVQGVTYRVSAFLVPESANAIGKSVQAFAASVGGTFEIPSASFVLVAGGARVSFAAPWANAGHTRATVTFRDGIGQGAFSFRVTELQYEPSATATPYSDDGRNYRLLDEGQTEIAQWWLGDKGGLGDAWIAMLALLNTEGPGARIYEDGRGRFVFKNRHAIVTESRSADVQYAISDAAQPSQSACQYDDGERSVINYAEIPVVTREADDLGEVWALGATLDLGPLESRTVLAVTADGSPVRNAVTPTTADGDYAVASGSVTSVTLDRDSGGIVPITITAGASGASITGLRLRAEALPVTRTTIVRSQGVDVAALGPDLRPWDRPILSEIDREFAQSLCDAIPGWYGEGVPSVTLELRGDNDDKLDAQLSLEIGDRISVTDSLNGLADDEFYVISIGTAIESGVLLVSRIVAESVLAGPFATWDGGEWDEGKWGL